MRRLAAILLATTALAPLPASAEPEPIEQELFDSWVGRYQDMTAQALFDGLGIEDPADSPLSFRPRDAKFYDEVVEALHLSPEALATLDQDGVVLVEPQHHYSMGAALYGIYTSDLPLLVTTDMILDAVHRSFDKILMELEETTLRQAMVDALKATRAELPGVVKATPGLKEAATDADLYLTVALNLLDTDPATDRRTFAPLLADDADVATILEKVDAMKLENPGLGGPSTRLYGEERAVDWTQFKPRGHYTKSERLKRYFRAMMWLGRADTGFELRFGRQLRAASLLTLAAERSGAAKRLEAVGAVIDLFVGRSDTLTARQLTDVLAAEKLDLGSALVGDAAMKRLRDTLAASGLGQQRIRSQLVVSPPSSPKKVAPPDLFQLFGQRFVLDSFVMAKVVYDDIVFEGRKMERRMPSPLDVMAALGNDVALRLLRPELERWGYAANLMALRDVVAAYGPDRWQASLYSRWLDALRVLATPPTGAHVPEVMTREPWARKMLQTQLASWAQLRHDTILYAKQSYTASVGCIYPKGFVEPYPAFYERLERFARAASSSLAALGGSGRHEAFFDRFAEVMGTLRAMALKELRAEPFSSKEERFLADTIERTMTGGGYDPQPNWDGWYMDLVYRAPGDDADAQVKWKPTIADVHTDPDSKQVLEVGTGDVHLAVVAVDNDGDTAIHVGPVFTYYAFEQPASSRLTDEEWSTRVGSPKTRPARPDWITPWTTGPAAP